MKKLIWIAVLMFAVSAAAQLTPAEKTDAQSVMTLMENKVIDLSSHRVRGFHSVYFKNCTFNGESRHATFYFCVFENCTFNTTLNNGKFINSYLDGGTFTKLEVKHGRVQNSNVPDAYLDSRTKKADRGKPFDKKIFTDKVKKQKEAKNR